MTTFATDTFTDTNGKALASHVPSDGGTWAVHPSYGPSWDIQANRARPSGAGALYHSGVPAGAEYDVQCDFINLGSSAIENPGICGRFDTAVNTMYHVRHNTSDWQLYRFVSGSVTLLGSYGQILTPGQTYSCVFEIRNATKKIIINGVERVTTPDNTITNAGKVGFRASNSSGATTGIHVDNFSAADLGGTTFNPAWAIGCNQILGDGYV